MDTNIILDWLGGREPFYAYVKELLKKAERKEITILLSTMTYITVEYILSKEIGKEKVRKALAGIRTITHICESGEQEIDFP